MPLLRRRTPAVSPSREVEESVENASSPVDATDSIQPDANAPESPAASTRVAVAESTADAERDSDITWGADSDKASQDADKASDAGPADDERTDLDSVPLNPSAPAFSAPVMLLRAAHFRFAALTAVALAAAAAISGRPLREVLLVGITVLVGQVVLGWHNDLVDAGRDHRHDTPNKPIAQGLLDPGTAWYALGVGVLALLPLAVLNGINAGICYLLAVAIGVIGNVALRDTWVSWLPWAMSWALFVPFLTLGGWGGQANGPAPEPVLMALAAGMGLCVHLLTSLSGLVADHKDGSGSLPLRLALRWGAPRVLWLASGALVALVVGTLVVARQISSGG